MITRRLPPPHSPLFHNLPRPRTTSRQPEIPRLFTQTSQLLFVLPITPRPQLPFLHSSSDLRGSRGQTRNQFPTQILRLLTTERKRYLTEQLWGAARITVYLWTLVGLIAVMAFGMSDEKLERTYPSPREWSWISRWSYRNARNQEDPEANANGLVDWASTGGLYRQLIQRLEDPKIDGQDLRPSLGQGEDIYVEGVGKTGLSVANKPEPWRRGYHQCLMGAARAAEHLDTWVRDKTRNIAFPSEVVIGLSNPRPKPVAFGAKTAPREEDCEPAFEAPQTYYMKILTAEGFSTRQRLDAALAYASWLNFKGLPSSAKDMHDWALDIASSGLPLGTSNVLNTKTGVINDNANLVTENVLLATRSLAIHHAQNNNLSSALPIFLSILRAQRNLPPPLPSNTVSPPTKDSLERDASFPYNLITTALSLLAPPAFPSPPPSGDMPATSSSISACNEAGTMAHIGEVLFASSLSANPAACLPLSASESSGLAWTRSAVTLAERTLRSLSKPSASLYASIYGDSQNSSSSDTAKVAFAETQATVEEAKSRCAECLTAGMDNWGKMVLRLQRIEAAKLEGALDSKPVDAEFPKPGPGSWFWRYASGSSTGEVREGKWAHEVRAVEEKAKDLQQLLREEGVSGEERPKGSVGGFWFV